MTRRICFVALKALGALGGDLRGRLGGAETQQARLARGLLRRGHEVSFILAEPREGLPEVMDGMRLISAYDPHAGLPGWRFLTRWRGLERALRLADADVYYQRAAGRETGQTALWCRAAARRFVFGVGSDSDCEAALPYLRGVHNKWLCRRGLRLADAIIAQTRRQQQLLEAHRLGSKLIRSIAPDVPPAARRTRGAATPPTLLWVGRFSAEKRPEWLLEMAWRRADWRFRIAGAANTPADGAGLLSAIRSQPNVELLGVLPASRMLPLYQQADLLVCTSKWEGFPNTYLEAWSVGVPIVSTVDTDDLLSTHGLGALAADPDGLVNAAQGVLNDPAHYAALQQAGWNHVTREHSEARVLDAFERLLLGAADAPHDSLAQAALTKGRA